MSRKNSSNNAAESGDIFTLGTYENATNNGIIDVSLGDLKTAVISATFSANYVCLKQWDNGSLTIDLLLAEMDGKVDGKHTRAVIVAEKDGVEYLNGVTITLRGKTQKHDLFKETSPGKWYCTEKVFNELKTELNEAKKRGDDYFKQARHTFTDQSGKERYYTYASWKAGKDDTRFPLEFVMTGNPIDSSKGGKTTAWTIESTLMRTAEN